MVISVENRKIFTPRVFCVPAEGNWVSAPGVKKLEWWATGPRKNFDDIFSHVDTLHQRDGQTDGHRATAKTALTHSVAR